MNQPTVGDIVSSEMDESEPIQMKAAEDSSELKPEIARASSLRSTGVGTAVAYRVTGSNDPVPVLVIPESSKSGPKNSSDWRRGASVLFSRR